MVVEVLTIYNAKLVSGDDTVGLGSTGGTGATARLTVNAAGNITAVKVMEGGGAYRVGDFLNVVGVGTTTGYSAGIVTVTGISNNIGDTLEIHPLNLIVTILIIPSIEY